MIITQIIAKIPPITGLGIAAKKAESLPTKPKTTNQIPTDKNTLRLATPVIDTTPAFVE